MKRITLLSNSEWIEPQDEDYHWLTQGTLNCSEPVAKTSGAAQAEAGMTSPSSMKTIQAAEKSEENGDSIDKSSHQATPLLPTEVTLATPLSDTSALSATPMTSLSTNDIPEIDDSAAREAAEAVRLERKDLTEDVNAVAPTSVSDARSPGNDRKLDQDENEDEKQRQDLRPTTSNQTTWQRMRRISLCTMKTHPTAMEP